jgi:Fur family ferric uptake transcriptional regulator
MTRNTRQREAVRQAFDASCRPLSPQDVLAAAQRDCPQLGIATVYRALKGLCEEGWLARVELPGQAGAYYERRQDHHHHFQCRRCDRLYRVDCSPLHVERFTPAGFLVERHELVLYGVCERCRTPVQDRS